MEYIKQVKIINQSCEYSAEDMVNDFLKYIDPNLIDDIVYKTVGGSLGGYNCIMIVYRKEVV